jgi:hypothetical protein
MQATLFWQPCLSISDGLQQWKRYLVTNSVRAEEEEEERAKVETEKTEWMAKTD